MYPMCRMRSAPLAWTSLQINYEREKKCNIAHVSYECTVSLGVALELLSSEDDNSPMSCYRNTRIVGSRLDGIINATLTGCRSSRSVPLQRRQCQRARRRDSRSGGGHR